MDDSPTSKLLQRRGDGARAPGDAPQSLVLALSTVIDAFMARVRAQLNLSANELNALLAVHTDGPQALSQLADRIHLSRPATGALIERLNERGLVERRTHPGDARKTLVGATDLFVVQFVAVTARWGRRIDALATTTEDWDTHARFLDELRRSTVRSEAELYRQHATTRRDR